MLRDKVIKVIEKVGIRAKRYLDLGCGNGTLTVAIAQVIKADDVYGIDVDEWLLRKLPWLVRGLKFNFEELDKIRLPFEDDYFDFVTAIEVIEHLSHGDHLINEVSRVLKPEGHFLLTTPNLASWVNRLLLAFGYQPMFTEPSKYYWIGLPKGLRGKRESVYGHKNLYTLRALLDILKAHRFTPCYIGGCRTFSDWFLSIVDGLLEKFPSMASILIVLAKKLAT